MLGDAPEREAGPWVVDRKIELRVVDPVVRIVALDALDDGIRESNDEEQVRILASEVLPIETEFWRFYRLVP